MDQHQPDTDREGIHMGKVEKDHKLLAALLGLSFDKKSKIIYGQKDGFPIIIHSSSTKKSTRFFVIIGARPTAEPLTLDDVWQFMGANPSTTLDPKQNQLLMVWETKQRSAQKHPEQQHPELHQRINALINLLQMKRFEPCCASCGQNVATSVYSITGSHLSDTYASMCPACISRIKVNIDYEKLQKHEKVLPGIAGALIGSLIGAFLTVLLAQLGFVSVLAGFVMAVCTFKGYELLGGKMTKKGIVICTLIMCFMTYMSNRMNWAILAALQLDINIFTSFRLVPYLLKEGLIAASTFRFNLLMLSLCSLAGVTVEVWSALKEGKIIKIGP